jgi:hypothetical protein
MLCEFCSCFYYDSRKACWEWWSCSATKRHYAWGLLLAQSIAIPAVNDSRSVSQGTRSTGDYRVKVHQTVHMSTVFRTPAISSLPTNLTATSRSLYTNAVMLSAACGAKVMWKRALLRNRTKGFYRATVAWESRENCISRRTAHTEIN